MKYAELKRYLRKKGAILVRNGGNHEIWGLNGNITQVSRHNQQEVPSGTLRKILSDLNLK
ncbi:type II toxin-antitoxin system HicA family toxin [Anaerobiospirillum thomasii]|uniref:type II toxin-antitoxin system HicA family toxin n=1 Tax=Anaerobiospirillum thomasii TaxID=179995 RepID=UPI000DE5A9C5